MVWFIYKASELGNCTLLLLQKKKHLHSVQQLVYTLLHSFGRLKMATIIKVNLK